MRSVKLERMAQSLHDNNLFSPCFVLLAPLRAVVVYPYDVNEPFEHSGRRYAGRRSSYVQSKKDEERRRKRQEEK